MVKAPRGTGAHGGSSDGMGGKGSSPSTGHAGIQSRTAMSFTCAGARPAQELAAPTLAMRLVCTKRCA